MLPLHPSGSSAKLGVFDPSIRFGVFDRYAPYTDLDALKDFSARPLRKSLRVNTLKTTVERFAQWARERGWVIEPVPWCAEGFFIDREPLVRVYPERGRRARGDTYYEALGKDLLHLLGHTYMQEAASMLPVALLDPQPGETILDMSAAPGSKTTQIAAKMNNRGVIIANDVQEKRLWTLKSALYRAGATNVIVTKKVGQWFARHMTERFDRVLCDAPCTAQGTIRKDSDALDYSSLENVGKMARLQRELLESAIDAAKVGGRIVYSTCTLTPEENEEVVASMLKKFEGRVEVVDPREKGIGKAIEDSLRIQKTLFPHHDSLFPAARLWPQTFNTEGFFCAVLQKTATTRHPERMDAIRPQEEEVPRARQKDIAATLESMYGTSFMLENDRLYSRGEQLLLATQGIVEFRLSVQDYALGLPFALRLGNNRLRLSHETATLRGPMATRGTHTIGDDVLDLLLDGKDATCPPDLHGDVILLYKNIPIGLALAKEGKLKNRLPRWVVQKS